MSVTQSDLKEALDEMYKTAYNLQAERMASAYTIQELQSQPEDNAEDITRIEGIIENIEELEGKIGDQIYTLKKAITIMEEGVDNIDIVW